MARAFYYTLTHSHIAFLLVTRVEVIAGAVRSAPLHIVIDITGLDWSWTTTAKRRAQELPTKKTKKEAMKPKREE
jgi:hypothetical protein